MAAQQVLDIDAVSISGRRSGVHQVLVRVLRPGSAAQHARVLLREVLQAAGVDGERRGDAELVVTELAANAELHARGPVELRVVTAAGTPVWCEVADGLPDLAGLPAVLDRLAAAGEEDAGTDLAADLAAWEENGRGLLLAQRLSGGFCCAYPTPLFSTGQPGKAVAFPLPAARPSS